MGRRQRLGVRVIRGPGQGVRAGQGGQGARRVRRLRGQKGQRGQGGARKANRGHGVGKRWEHPPCLDQPEAPWSLDTLR